MKLNLSKEKVIGKKKVKAKEYNRLVDRCIELEKEINRLAGNKTEREQPKESRPVADRTEGEYRFDLVQKDITANGLCCLYATTIDKDISSEEAYRIVEKLERTIAKENEVECFLGRGSIISDWKISCNDSTFWAAFKESFLIKKTYVIVLDSEPDTSEGQVTDISSVEEVLKPKPSSDVKVSASGKTVGGSGEWVRVLFTVSDFVEGLGMPEGTVRCKMADVKVQPTEVINGQNFYKYSDFQKMFEEEINAVGAEKVENEIFKNALKYPMANSRKPTHIQRKFVQTIMEADLENYKGKEMITSELESLFNGYFSRTSFHGIYNKYNIKTRKTIQKTKYGSKSVTYFPVTDIIVSLRSTYKRIFKKME